MPSISWHKWKQILQVHLKTAGRGGWATDRLAALLGALGIKGQHKYFAAQAQLEVQAIPNATQTALGSAAVPMTDKEAAATESDAAALKTPTECDTLLQFLDELFAETANVLAERHLFTTHQLLPVETFLKLVAALKQ